MMRAVGARVTGDTAWFPRCPAAYVTAFTERMLRLYLWLDHWGKSPLELGMTMADVDPRYWPAMESLKRELLRIEREELERIRAGADG